MTLGDVAIERKESLKGSKAGLPTVGLEHLIPKQITLTTWSNGSENTFSKIFHKGQVLFGRRRAYLKKAVGSLSPRVKWEHLKKYEFELPDMEEQRKLAELLWSMVEAKEAYQELLQQTDELVKAQFVEMFDKKGWPLIKLEQLCDSIVRGPFGSALKVSFFVKKAPDTVKVYEQKNAIQASAELGNSYKNTKN